MAALLRWRSAISPGVCTALQRDGCAVIDGALGANWCLAARGEVERVWRAGRLHANATHIVRAGERQLLPKASILEAELLDPAVQAVAPLVAELQADATLRTMLSLLLPRLRLDSQAIKLQVNEGGGGCFPMHCDSDEEVDGRRVSAIFYLNPHWRPGDGGELRLYPFPREPVDIAPACDRIVLFPSTTMLHRVLPSKRDRYCFTLWLSQSRGRPPPPTPLPVLLQEMSAPASREALVALLREPQARRYVSKLFYAAPWAASIEESHAPSPARDAALEQHWREARALEAVFTRLCGVSGKRLRPHLLDLALAAAPTAWL
ncbi:hypothetical protein WJX81_004197 [Elliptochloris bilobata]|uniref:Fe2OG dioxygenase domain-containing protein n=1 Tax=Elliptochloris bilobata TaxID=381761 RepID=A0AAW1QY67_9CHLO